ncbi:MAG: ComEC/Rec2 family competence protein [Bacteroidia bacterium]|nr:ComEC/Rec2 family competence protein [Bacteroidia bacterium]
MLIPFVSGILLAAEIRFVKPGLNLWWPLIAGWLLLLTYHRSTFRQRHIFGLILQVYFLLGGYGFTVQSMEWLRPRHYANYLTGENTFLAETLCSARERTKSFRLLVNIHAVKQGSAWKQCDGKMFVYIRKTPGSAPPGAGEKIVLKGRPEFMPIEKERLSTTLNHHRQIYYRVFAGAMESIESKAPWYQLSQTAFVCRAWVTETLMRQFARSKEAAIAVALLVGEEVSIDESLSEAYAATGTLHVLSVSGMHVGLIYLLLGFMFKPLLRSAKSAHVYYPLVIVLVWLYALVAGAVPAIVRAAAMCTFHLLAKWMDRKNEGIGALGASLFFILLVNPFNLYEPGLQLSFFAVWGIIWLQRPVLKLWVPRNRLLFRAWELTCVSLAAQLLTLPVSLFYFGQFPNYFILANLFVIPLTTACIYGCILQLLFTCWPWALSFIVWMNSFILKISNFLVLEMKDWPGAISHWDVNLKEACLLYALLFILEDWLRTKRFVMLLFLEFVLVIYSLLSLFRIA